MSCSGLFSDFLFHRQLAAAAELPAAALYGESGVGGGSDRGAERKRPRERMAAPPPPPPRLRVERLEAHSITPAEFYKRFVDPGVPVVLTQVRWPSEGSRRDNHDRH